MLHPLLRLFLTALVLAAPLSTEATTPSFECGKAGTPAERTICSNDGLAALDRQLADVFAKLRERTPDDAKPVQLKEQQRWLRGGRDRCAASLSKKPPEPVVAAAVACLSARYRVRIGELLDQTSDADQHVRRPDLAPASDAANDPRHTLVRIQSALEHAAALGKASVHSQSDRFGSIVLAYWQFLSDDPAAMDATLETLRGAIRAGREALLAEHKSDAHRKYFDGLDAAATSAAPLVRLLAALRSVDSILFLEMAGGSAFVQTRHVSRLFAYAPSPLSDTWLKLPCRTIVGRADAFEAARQQLGEAAGELLACPADGIGYVDLASLARDPARFEIRPPAAAPAVKPRDSAPPLPSPPWNREAAVAHMGERPELAEPVLEAASRTDAMGKLDYALFLYAFRADTWQRNVQINALLQDILDQAKPERDPVPTIADMNAIDPEALVEIVRFTSVSQIADPGSAFYVIPCAILVARPALLAAIEPYYGSTRDNFVPRSGCAWGRGEIRDYPEQEIRAFMLASEVADGDFIDTYTGTAKFGHITGREAMIQAMAVDLRAFLDDPKPVLEHPYQTWGATGLSAYHTSLRIRDTYWRARDHLVEYGLNRGMSGSDAARAAKTALFRLVYGAECGDAPPGESTRAMIIAGSPEPAVIARLGLDHQGESAAVLDCARYASLEPIEHVAVAQPTVLEHLLLQGHDVDAANDFGKTPLMVAAQFDQVESARILLSRGAAVNATTWQDGDLYEVTLYHDARTPLMYAAANASLPMLELLLRAGADPYRADTKGRRAIDYLLGFGPTAANPKLTPEERSEAARLLY